MSIVVIESEFLHHIEAFRNGPEIAEFCTPDTQVEAGTSEGHEFADPATDEVRYGVLHYLILTGAADEDNATYRIDEAGQLAFHMVGVEV